MTGKYDISIRSEIGILEGVILHTPGQEIQNMTPQNAQRALYSDLLNLNVAKSEYAQFKGVLDKYTHTFEVSMLLSEVLYNEKVKQDLLEKICYINGNKKILRELMQYSPEKLTSTLIEGIMLSKNSLTSFLNDERYALQPLHNFFYTRDASVTIKENVFISSMASKVREREAIIMETIFNYHPNFNTKTHSASDKSLNDSTLSIEGGDILIAREDIILIGLGSRTNSYGIDHIIELFKSKGEKMHIIAQELPHSPESFIHLDMVFTIIDKDACMVYEPLILKDNRYRTVHVYIDNGEVKSITIEKGILDALQKLGMNLNPLFCGGKNDTWIQEREQWHSGANFFAIAPGKIMGYGRNQYTIEELNKNGFEVITASEIINETKDANNYSRCVITIEGSELSRGGGGARCMTMPVKRSEISW